MIYIRNNKVKLYAGSTKIKKAYIGATKVYSAGNIVTYYVNSGVSYKEEVDEGATCLSPKTFTPAISGWTFVGWRTDATASGSVLSSKVMGDSPITLYAVFRQTITLTYYNGNATKQQQSGYRYYNNGNVANPVFTINPAAISGWTFTGWSASTVAGSAISYSSIVSRAFSSNATVCAQWHRTITLSYGGNGATSGSTAAQTGTQYFNSGNYYNPSFTLRANGFARTNYTFANWRLGSASGTAYNAGATVQLGSNTTFYAAWNAVNNISIPCALNMRTDNDTVSGTLNGKAISGYCTDTGNYTRFAYIPLFTVNTDVYSCIDFYYVNGFAYTGGGDSQYTVMLSTFKPNYATEQGQIYSSGGVVKTMETWYDDESEYEGTHIYCTKTNLTNHRVDDVYVNTSDNNTNHIRLNLVKNQGFQTVYLCVDARSATHWGGDDFIVYSLSSATARF